MRIDEFGAGMAMSKKKSGRSTDYVIEEFYTMFDPVEEFYIGFQAVSRKGEPDRNGWKIRRTSSPLDSGTAYTAEEAQQKLDKYKSLVAGEKYVKKQEAQIRRMERNIKKIEQKYANGKRMPTKDDRNYLKYYKNEMRNARKNLNAAGRQLEEFEDIIIVHVQVTHKITPA